MLTLLGAGLVHAGMNVLNDYYDEQNGTDRRNGERLFPFTGGSRFIQNQVLSAARCPALRQPVIADGDHHRAGTRRRIWRWATGHRRGGAAAGLGLFSTAPANSRGWGEPHCHQFRPADPAGRWYVQTGQFAAYPLLINLPLALLLMNILLINQFPDQRADAPPAASIVEVVRLGATRAAPRLSG
ncbi:MAG: hypothetical protein R3E89_18015 [Thiolinea sp.]